MKILKFNEFLNEDLIEDILVTIETVKEYDLKKELFEPLKIKFIDTPGGFREKYSDYDDIEDYLTQLMGTKSYKELFDFVNKNKDTEVMKEFLKKHKDKEFFKELKKYYKNRNEE